MRRLTPLLAFAAIALAGPAVAPAAARAGSTAPQRVTIKLMPTVAGHEVNSGTNFAIEPGIPVTVTFVNTSRQYHTFSVPTLGVNALILPGRPDAPRVTHVTFTANTYGVFRWHCTFCPGVHHQGSMNGKVYAIIGV
jgi:plastocyanin